jgi:hypothetical protein
MFVFDRNALAVLLPLALLVTVVVLSNRDNAAPAAKAQAHSEPDRSDQVAANLPSR